MPRVLPYQSLTIIVTEKWSFTNEVSQLNLMVLIGEESNKLKESYCNVEVHEHNHSVKAPSH